MLARESGVLTSRPHGINDTLSVLEILRIEILVNTLWIITEKSSWWYPRKIIEAEINIGDLTETFKRRVTDIENLVATQV